MYGTYPVCCIDKCWRRLLHWGGGGHLGWSEPSWQSTVFRTLSECWLVSWQAGQPVETLLLMGRRSRGGGGWGCRGRVEWVGWGHTWTLPSALGSGPWIHWTAPTLPSTRLLGKQPRHFVNTQTVHFSLASVQQICAFWNTCKHKSIIYHTDMFYIWRK